MNGVRRLARRAGLQAPGPVEVAPVPDASAGMTYAGVIRLQPAPPLRLLATLLHETGHLGVARSRPVEEAIADLTRRALLELWVAEHPGDGPDLLPVLVEGRRPQVSRPVSPQADPLAPEVYQHATRLALALMLDAETKASPETPLATLYARAAIHGRRLLSIQVEALAEALLPAEELPAAVAGDLSRRVAPRLRQFIASRPEAASFAVLEPLAVALETGDRGALQRYLEAALSRGENAAHAAHAVVLALDPGAEGEFLDAWLEAARLRRNDAEVAVALTRRATHRERSGHQHLARNDLWQVLMESTDPFAAAVAAVNLADLDDLGSREVQALMDRSPSMAGCTGPLQGHVLHLSGHPRAAAASFARAAGAAREWSLSLGWAKALAAAGDASAAAALLRAHAHRGVHRAEAGSALLAAALMDESAGEQQLLRASRLLRRHAGRDRALAAAARLAGPAGARRYWRRLVRQAPFSDLAVEAYRRGRPERQDR